MEYFEVHCPHKNYSPGEVLFVSMAWNTTCQTISSIYRLQMQEKDVVKTFLDLLHWGAQLWDMSIYVSTNIIMWNKTILQQLHICFSYILKSPGHHLKRTKYGGGGGSTTCFAGKSKNLLSGSNLASRKNTTAGNLIKTTSFGNYVS